MKWSRDNSVLFFNLLSSVFSFFSFSSFIRYPSFFPCLSFVPHFFYTFVISFYPYCCVYLHVLISFASLPSFSYFSDSSLSAVLFLRLSILTKEDGAIMQKRNPRSD
jgi:hypothetical protein